MHQSIRPRSINTHTKDSHICTTILYDIFSMRCVIVMTQNCSKHDMCMRRIILGLAGKFVFELLSDLSIPDFHCALAYTTVLTKYTSINILYPVVGISNIGFYNI